MHSAKLCARIIEQFRDPITITTVSVKLVLPQQHTTNVTYILQNEQTRPSPMTVKYYDNLPFYISLKALLAWIAA